MNVVTTLAIIFFLTHLLYFILNFSINLSGTCCFNFYITTVVIILNDFLMLL